MSNPEQEALFRERMELDCWLGEWLTDEMTMSVRTLRLGPAGTFRMAYMEEAEAIGYDGNDQTILIRRESDGQLFEVEIEVMTRRATPKEAKAPS